MVNSVEYYNKNSEAFLNRTINVDMSTSYHKFLSQLSPGACILDAGCGVGRDAQYFANSGYTVTTFDASIEMVRLSSELLGKQTLHLFFQDIDFKEAFDGVWAAASLLHVPYESQRGVMERLHQALKPNGIFFACFKHGNGRRIVEDRVFYDMDEKIILPYVKGLFHVIENWQSPDNISKIAPSSSKTWLNMLCQKI